MSAIRPRRRSPAAWRRPAPWVGSIALLLFGTACQGTSRYAFGDYQESVFAVTMNEGEANIDASIASLNETVERTVMNDRLVPPGMHAHIGFLYALRGDIDFAVAAFESEKELYPESSVFIDGMLRRMGVQQ